MARPEHEPAGPGAGRLERAIAAHARRLRRDRGVTLTGMAARVGISKAMLSKIENAQISCSLTTLGRLAEALDVPVTAFFRDADADRRAVFTPAGAGAPTEGGGPPCGHDQTLPAGLRAGQARMEAHLVTLTDRSATTVREHPGTELIFMLEGAMVYGHDGDRYTLHPGDTLALDAGDAHGPVSLVEVPVRFLSVVAAVA